MIQLPKNQYTRETLEQRLGVQVASDILLRRLSYAECIDLDGHNVTVRRQDTVLFPNNTSIYIVNLL